MASTCCDESPLERSLRVQEDFEAALAAHRAQWMAQAAEEKAKFMAEFEERKKQLAVELDHKLGARKHVEKMLVSVFFVLRLIS